MVKKKSIRFIAPTVGFTACLAGLFLVIAIASDMKKRPSALEQKTEEESQKSLDLGSKSKEYIAEKIAEIRALPVHTQAESALLMYAKNDKNIFFDSEEFFAKITLTAQDIDTFKKSLQDISKLDQVVYDDRPDAAVPEILMERINTHDFMMKYAEAHIDSLETETIKSAFRDLFVAAVPSDASIKIKRILVAEKIDLIKSLTILDRHEAVDAINSLSDNLKSKVRHGFYLGLRTLPLDDEEYQEWVSKVYNPAIEPIAEN